MSTQSIQEKLKLPKRFGSGGASVWNEYTQLLVDYKPLNLGHGVADYAVPKYMTDALVATANGPDYMLNQYARGSGHPRLVKALSKLYSKLINREIEPFTEILITCGAYEALHTTIRGHIEVGDEVILIEPSFDCYESLVTASGGVPRYIPLRLKPGAGTGDYISSGDYVLDDAELAGLFNEKTKMIILNTPNNPLGKVFNEEELTKIADLCKKYNVLCVSDEVYEWMVYGDTKHFRICTLPGMWERTITIGSAGKTFSLTGWRTGWAYGPANLLYNLQMVHQYCVDSCPAPLQEAVAIVIETESKRLDSPECYLNVLPAELKAKRDFIARSLKEVGFRVILPQGGYFINADWSPLEKLVDLNSEKDAQRDYRFTKWMTKNVGVQGIPPSTFFNQKNKHLMENFVRYCFFKKDENLQKAADAFQKWVNK